MRLPLIAVSGAALLTAGACASAPTQTPAPAPTVAAAAPAPAPVIPPPPPNPLFAPWTGAHGGIPPFDQVKVEQFKPALEAGMEEQRAELAKIAGNPAPATFENTLAAMENAGRTFSRVETLYGIWKSSMKSPEFQAVEREMEPRLAAFQDEIVQNGPLFQRIETVYAARETSGLTPEQQRLAWLYHTNFVRAGAQLDAAGKKRVAEINQRLATLFSRFSQNVLWDEENDFVVLSSAAELDGLSDSMKASAAAAAKARGLEGKWLIANTRSAMEPFLTNSRRRELREQVWRHFVDRGDHRGEHDNNPLVVEILQLRAERAKLLGYPTHAHWRVENAMAKTPERAMELMEAVWTPAVARVRQEVADMQRIATREGAKFRIAPWDYRYYAEKVRKARYDFDEGEVKPYLQLEKLREGMFHVAGELFGLDFAPVDGVPVYHPDVRVWRVTDRHTGAEIGLWYFDPYARPGKRSGAWMNAYRPQEDFLGPVTTLVSNNCNFVKPAPGEAVLVSWEDARTLFHEFGHAVHGLSSQVHYPSLSGTAVARDYVEFPSQLLEHWRSTPEILNTYAVHVRTGKPIPAALVKKVEKAATFNQGFITTEYLISALVDMKLHLEGSRPVDPAAFEKKTLHDLGMPEEIVMRHRIPQFSHLFSSDAYSAGYYSYLWSDTLSADAYEAFTEAGGPWDKAVAERLRKNVFSVGNTVDPAVAYRAFRGRDPGIAALMRRRGFPVPSGAAKATTRSTEVH
jgi:peptidyl-dipeptidase Dcp